MAKVASKTSPYEVRFTIEDLIRLNRQWSKSDRFHGTELIDGRIYHTPARYIPRASMVTRLYLALREGLEAVPGAPEAMMRVSIAMPPHDLPLPDLLLNAGYEGSGFVPCRCVPLVIEVAQSAVSFFMGKKLRIYAKHCVPEYWVVDLRANAVHQMWAPGADGYAGRREVTLGTRIEAVTIAGLGVETRGLD